jgi:hypothetical protein
VSGGGRGSGLSRRRSPEAAAAARQRRAPRARRPAASAQPLNPAPAPTLAPPPPPPPPPPGARGGGGPPPPRRRYPGESPSRTRANQFSSNAGYNISSAAAQNPPASDIDYVYLAGREMVVPGTYTLLVVAKSGTPSTRLTVRGAGGGWKRTREWAEVPGDGRAAGGGGGGALAPPFRPPLSSPAAPPLPAGPPRPPAAVHRQRAHAHRRRRAHLPQGAAVRVLPLVGPAAGGAARGAGRVVRQHRARNGDALRGL